jgi:hypothetical protein
LVHVRAGIELQLDDRGALDRLRFDVLDACDVEEVIFVVVGKETLHLRGIHAAIWLRDVDRRDAERRKDVARHALDCERGAEHECEHDHEDRDRTAQRGTH